MTVEEADLGGIALPPFLTRRAQNLLLQALGIEVDLSHIPLPPEVKAVEVQEGQIEVVAEPGVLLGQ